MYIQFTHVQLKNKWWLPSKSAATTKAAFADKKYPIDVSVACLLAYNNAVQISNKKLQGLFGMDTKSFINRMNRIPRLKVHCINRTASTADA